MILSDTISKDDDNVPDMRNVIGATVTCTPESTTLLDPDGNTVLIPAYQFAFDNNGRLVGPDGVNNPKLECQTGWKISFKGGGLSINGYIPPQESGTVYDLRTAWMYFCKHGRFGKSDPNDR